MKITKGQLRRIIKEEKAKLTREAMSAEEEFENAGIRGREMSKMRGNPDAGGSTVQLTDLQIAFIRHCAGAYVEVGLDDMLGEYPSREQMMEIMELTKLR